jgi:sec1 family domain-containing protein 1
VSTFQSLAMASSYSVSASTQQQPVQSLRDLQRKALLKLLNLNSEEEEQNAQANDLLPQVANGEPVWKFLVFDKLGQDIISSVLRVSDLREAGVTVHMQLKADRLQMEDVPASTFLK